jgi:MoaA/NifB/PqqE/SkfB family radical SAM enzyme
MKSYNFEGHKLPYHLDRVHDFLTNGDCFPLYMEISPVGSCNHRCIFCAYDFIGYPNRKLETTRTIKLLDELAECGLRSILFAGEGEPLLHPDIGRFISHAKQNGIDVGLFTNGQLLKEELAEEILPYLTFVRFSFNGGSRDNYAAIHSVRPEIFDTVIHNIRSAVRIKRSRNVTADIGAQFVLIPENAAFLLDAIATLQDAGIDYLAIKPFVQQSSQQCYQLARPLDPEMVGALLHEAESRATADSAVMARKTAFAEYGKRGYHHCYGTSYISVLNSAGDLATCLPYWDRKEFVFGNIHESSFKEIWSSERRRHICHYLATELDAKSCPPNCRPHAINEFLWEIKHPSVNHLNFI